MVSDLALSGFLLVDKPAGLSSFDVIRQLRKQTGIRTFGHAGTLDPFATGLMIIAVNRYTRLLSLLDNQDKTYQAVLEFGKQTATGDPEGEVISVCGKVVSSGEVYQLIPKVKDITALIPPRHSALKVDGKRAYDLARDGKDFSLAARDCTIMDFAVVDYQYPFLTYKCRVSKGTYIRSLSEWIAASLDTVGYTTGLRRLAIGKTAVDSASRLESINGENIHEHFINPLDIITHLQSVSLMDNQIIRLKNGNPIAWTVDSLFGSTAGNILPPVTDIMFFDASGTCQGVGYLKDNYLHPKINL